MPDDVVPQLVERTEDGRLLSALVWQVGDAARCVSTAAVGGGFAEPRWLVNAQVKHGYRRTDLGRHAEQMARVFALTGPGVVMFTAVDVRLRQTVTVDGVTVTATVGVSDPVWAADRADEPAALATPAGTINVVVHLPAALAPGAMVNIVATVTEAKCQALADATVAGTGTPSDAVAVVCSRDDTAPDVFGGPRSTLGRPTALAAYRAISAGLSTGLSAR
jgi:adenosylcobinamide amidohydrolase